MSYYFSIFRRKLPYFLVVAVLISALAVTVALSLPPAYVSQVRLILEAPQIPTDLAASTVSTPVLEQMQIFEQRLLTRANMLDIARRLEVLADQDQMNPDDIVRAMRARTSISRSTGSGAASLMTISFEAPTARNAAAVLNEYLNVILQENAEIRTGRAGETLQFFQQEVDRLGGELDAQSVRILDFKSANADALPEGLQFRLNQQSSVQERLSQTEREIASLREQRDRMVQIFDQTGRIDGGTGAQMSPEERELESLRSQVADALLIYSAENPRVRLLQSRLTQMENAMRDRSAQAAGDASNAQMSMLDVQLAQLDSRIAVLGEDRERLTKQLAALTDAVDRTPANAIALSGLDRTYSNIQGQYNTAVDRLARASTGERIELLSRGQRIGVIEQPAVPNTPTKPNRVLIAGGGSLAGILAGLALVVLLELLNTSAKRPVDLVNKLGISPIATIPYIRTQGENFRRRSAKFAVLLAILIGVPAAVLAVHVFYQPLDLIADRVMNMMGVRW